MQTEPDEAALFALEQAFNSTDTSAAQVDAPDPVEVGNEVTYTVIATNLGPNPASRVLISDELPDNVDLVSVSAGCEVDGSGDVSCEVGELLKGEQDQIQIRVDTDDVCIGGVPPILSNFATVSNDPPFAGTDPDATNDSATEMTTVVDTTPPVVSCNAPATIVPPDAEVSFTASAVDLCDDDPVVEVVDFTCYQIKKNGQIIDKTKSCVVTLNADSITISDSGGSMTTSSGLRGPRTRRATLGRRRAPLRSSIRARVPKERAAIVGRRKNDSMHGPL